MTPAATTAQKDSPAQPAEGIPSQLAYLTRVLKTPTIGRVWQELAAHARDENWSHEEYLAAVLQRQLADRESAGTITRIRTAHFPAVKTIEDFNLDHLPSLRRSASSTTRRSSPSPETPIAPANGANSSPRTTARPTTDQARRGSFQSVARGFIPIRRQGVHFNPSLTGLTLRKLTYRGGDLIVPFPEAVPIPDYRGIVAAPWPNRIADGLYNFDREYLHLPANEPELGCALCAVRSTSSCSTAIGR